MAGKGVEKGALGWEPLSRRLNNNINRLVFNRRREGLGLMPSSPRPPTVRPSLVAASQPEARPVCVASGELLCSRQCLFLLKSVIKI